LWSPGGFPHHVSPNLQRALRLRFWYCMKRLSNYGVHRIGGKGHPPPGDAYVEPTRSVSAQRGYGFRRRLVRASRGPTSGLT
jgi:hypothetical protein